MHEFWIILVTNVTCIRPQNYTNVLVGEARIQTFKVVVVAFVVVVRCFVPQLHIPHDLWTCDPSKYT